MESFVLFISALSARPRFTEVLVAMVANCCTSVPAEYEYLRSPI
jgi:hypothetical protein